MKKLKIFFIALTATVVLFIAGGFLFPSHWEVTRSIVIQAPAGAIYPYVANLKTGWPKWSAFDLEDPNLQYTYAGVDEGAGATRSWTSKKMGNGTQRITKGDPAVGIEFELEMEGNQFKLMGHMVFEPAENGATKVTWKDEGEVGMHPIYRYMGALMDKMMGRTFERSLETLKRHVETTAAPPASVTPAPMPSHP